MVLSLLQALLKNAAKIAKKIHYLIFLSIFAAQNLE